MSWYYSYRPAKPKAVVNGIKTKSTKGAIGNTWWSKRWIEVLESFNIGERLSRGKTYARKGQVISIDIEPGIVKAKVQGTRVKPYSVKINLKTLTEEDWHSVIEHMSSQAIYAAKLLSGEMPQNIEEAFRDVNISLLPERHSDLVTDCSCPDWSNPCKHIAAVYYLIAEKFDEDPFLLFRLRGKTKEEIMSDLRDRRAGREEVSESWSLPFVPVTPLEESMENFWQSGEELENLSISLNPSRKSIVIKHFENFPFMYKGNNISEFLINIYREISQKALKKLEN
jgi:uncharacterized Zn finger protein